MDLSPPRGFRLLEAAEKHTLAEANGCYLGGRSMIFFLVKSPGLFQTEALRAELARARLHPTVHEDGEGLAIALGRWGSVYLQAQARGAVAGPSARVAQCGDLRSHEYVVVAQPTATALAHAVGRAIAAAALGTVSSADGTAAFTPEDLERCALAGPVVATDADAFSALGELEAGDSSKIQPLASYIRTYVGNHGPSLLRRAFEDWCCRVGLGDDTRAIEAATVAESLGVAPATRAARPEAEAAFERAREAHRLYQRER